MVLFTGDSESSALAPAGPLGSQAPIDSEIEQSSRTLSSIYCGTEGSTHQSSWLLFRCLGRSLTLDCGMVIRVLHGQWWWVHWQSGLAGLLAIQKSTTQFGNLHNLPLLPPSVDT